jgi:hypothetical protein
MADKLAHPTKLAVAKTPNETTVLQRQIDSTDDQIDRLVYELYGLTLRRTRLCRAGSRGD